MGKTAYSGPVYGAKANLFSVGPVAPSTGGSTALVARTVVPAYERWIVTEMAVSCSTNSSLYNTVLKAKGGSTSVDYPAGTAGTIATVTGPTSTAGFNLIAAPTPTAGEYEGYVVAENSTLRIVSSGINAPSNYYIQVRGFVRYIDSTRAS